jgi:transposase
MREWRRRVFPETFKREAVDRVRTSGLPIVRVAEDLGLHETVLRRWITRYAEPASPWRAGTQAAPLSPADLGAENVRLKRELHRAETERDIPKIRPWPPPACAQEKHLLIRSEAGRAAAVSLLVGSTPLKNVAHGFMRT